MAYDAHANNAISSVATAPTPASSGTSLIVATGHGSRFSDPSGGKPVVVLLWPDGEVPSPQNSELVLVGAKSGDTLSSLTRGYRGSTAQAVTTGFLVAQVATAETWEAVEDVVDAAAADIATLQSDVADHETRITDLEGGAGEIVIPQIMYVDGQTGTNHYAATRDGIVAALAALGGHPGIVDIAPYLGGISISTDISIDTTHNDVEVIWRPGSYPTCPASGAVNMFRISGTTGSTTTLTANAARGDLSVTVSSVTGFTAGGLILLNDPSDSHTHMSVIENVNAGTKVITFTDPLSDAFTTANSCTAAPVTPVKRFKLSWTTHADGNSNASTVRAFYATYTQDCEFSYRCKNFAGDTAALDWYGYRNKHLPMSIAEDCPASAGPINVAHSTRSHIGPVYVRNCNSGFAIWFSNHCDVEAYCAYNTGRQFIIGSSGAGGGCADCTFRGEGSHSLSGGTGISFRGGSHHNIAYVRAYASAAENIWFSDQSNHHNMVYGLAQAATTYDVAFGSSDYANEFWGQYTTYSDAGANCINGVLDRQAGVEFSNDNAEKTLYSKTIVGGTLKLGHAVKLHIGWYFFNNSGADRTLTIKVKYGATTMINDVTASLAVNGFNRAGVMEIVLQNQGATNAQLCTAVLRLSAPTSNTSGLGDLGTVDSVDATMYGTAAEDSTADKTLAVTITMSAADTNLKTGRNTALLQKVG